MSPNLCRVSRQEAKTKSMVTIELNFNITREEKNVEKTNSKFSNIADPKLYKMHTRVFSIWGTLLKCLKCLHNSSDRLGTPATSVEIVRSDTAIS